MQLDSTKASVFYCHESTISNYMQLDCHQIVKRNLCPFRPQFFIVMATIRYIPMFQHAINLGSNYMQLDSTKVITPGLQCLDVSRMCNAMMNTSG